MKAIWDIRPITNTDVAVITATSALTGYPVTNLSLIQPMKFWKSANLNSGTTLHWDFQSTQAFSGFFLNRFNFGSFTLYGSINNATWVTLATVTNAVQDELKDENYMHYYCSITGSYRYYKLVIISASANFGETTFRVGNALFGTEVIIWNPAPPFKVVGSPKVDVVVYDSNYSNSYKSGRGKHILDGNFDKITVSEYIKIVKTINPFVISLSDFTLDNNDSYLVKATPQNGFEKSYEYTAVVDMPFHWEEVV